MASGAGLILEPSVNKRLELQQKRNRQALTKSLTVDSSGDAGERLEDDRAVRVCS